ncbi:hypothetical protein ACQCX2_01850 [Propionibacteriaceae bacterium Y1700]|uniref:hypothetical protein n=1 Tax=Microlunatus sp. Y1700 TaxID=3418487 RepID=UPI003DA73D3C
MHVPPKPVHQARRTWILAAILVFVTATSWFGLHKFEAANPGLTTNTDLTTAAVAIAIVPAVASHAALFFLPLAILRTGTLCARRWNSWWSYLLCWFPSAGAGTLLWLLLRATPRIPTGEFTTGFLSIMSTATTYTVPALFLPFVLTGLIRHARKLAHIAGFRTQAEKAQEWDQDRRREARTRAEGVFHSLVEGYDLPTLRPHDVMLRDNEIVHLDAPLTYERYYSTDASYVHNSSFIAGSASFVGIGLIAQAIGNSSRRNRALADAQLRWRETQTSRTLLTNQRFLIHAGGRWLSFYHSGVQAFYPEPDNWLLVVDYPDTQPLQLSGFAAPHAAILLAHHLKGVDSLRTHVGFSSYRERLGIDR